MFNNIATIRPGIQTRSLCAENPTGTKSGGAQATPGDPGTAPWASELSRGWKVRPCIRDVKPGDTLTLADVAGPGVVQHIWMTVLMRVHRHLRFEVYYDGAEEPSIRTPLGDFFANGVDGKALVNSQAVTVAPLGGMNSYWPIPFRKHLRITVTNDGPETIDEFFYQITYAMQPVADDAGYLHVGWRRSMTREDHPEHTIIEGLCGPGHYAGTYLVWNQTSNGWWGEGEMKFFIDNDPRDAPTICGTGTEDYFGGAWGFIRDLKPDMTADQRPRTYSAPFLGYPQALFEPSGETGPRTPCHALYRWHWPDPIRFEKDLRVTVQALGWYPTRKYRPLCDDIASTAYWYQRDTISAPPLPPL
ncbi:MAG: DUF2961 domain-containing protein, partial [Rhodospirillales bacterium]|nr:DUF2961 domain-containing protein [Rhodospirillales bacterium]